MLLPSASEAFLARHEKHSTYYDAVACVLSGLLPLKHSLFDIKIWGVVQAKDISNMVYSLPSISFNLAPVTNTVVSARLQSLHGAVSSTSRNSSLKTMAQSTSNHSTHVRIVGFLGLLYMCGGVVSSFLYITVSKDSLTNDFLWRGFGDSNTHSFLSNWFNANLQLLSSSTAHTMQINDPRHGLFATTNNVTQESVLSSALYATAIQDQVNSLNNVIQGLRVMDSCNLPWIATAYCYADFDQRWHMAYSTQRQQRCLAEATNGAVYMEAMLRNANWPTLTRCWGTALETAVFSGIRGTNGGTAWVQSLQSTSLSMVDEVAYWQAHHITRFATQWQNYKLLGVTETFVVANAMGTSFPITLKRTDSSFHLSAATSFKMYWSFANDLLQVGTNGSSLSGMSLVQQTRNYAYTNSTLQNAMMAGGAVLASPMDPALYLLSITLGPFGVVDMKRVAVPDGLLDLYRAMSQFLKTKLSSSAAIQQAYWSMYALYYLTPHPQAWDRMKFYGGDINCGLNFGGYWRVPFQFFSRNGICAIYLRDYLSPYTHHVLMSIVATGSQAINATTQLNIGRRDPNHAAGIAAVLNTTLGFLKDYFAPMELAQFDALSHDVQATLRDTIGLELMQYWSSDDVNYNLTRVNIFDPTESDWHFFSWFYLFEWVEGKREVVSFQGDLGTITTLSSVQNLDERPVNAQEIPHNVSTYFLVAIEYITVVLFAVGCLVVVSIVASHGYIEGTNMFSFGLVAGHVWVGRPLVLLRGFVAICLLSTSTLTLTQPYAGLVSFFASP
ncbi:hypothetical protein As57867_005281, partial [Aphanomyces stellatus]